MRIGMTSDLMKTRTVSHWRTIAEGVHKSVADTIISAGALPIIFPTVTVGMIPQVLKLVDGIILTGGLDVDPHFYHEKRTPLVLPVNPKRDRFELQLTRQAIQMKKPVLGLCRGLQLINVALGGSLYQNIDTEVKRPHPIRHQQSLPGDRTSHSIQIKPGTFLFKTLGQKTWVNSRHHEAVKNLGHGLVVSAVAPDGIIEAIESPDGLLQGVQWHPEDLCRRNAGQRRLFSDFVQRVAAESHQRVG